jgi:2-(1,2-epoxy-1,2-dihydrophenyl)acetyl-CoA isomerase
VTEYQAIIFEQTGSVTRIALNRPDAANGMNHTMTRPLPVLSAQEAAQWGLVTEVVADAELNDRTTRLADQMASGARKSTAAVKLLLLNSLKNGIEEQMELEARLIAECADSADGHEGVDAFMAKRPPEFA